MKTQEDYPTTEKYGKERLEDYSTSGTWLCMYLLPDYATDVE